MIFCLALPAYHRVESYLPTHPLIKYALLIYLPMAGTALPRTCRYISMITDDLLGGEARIVLLRLMWNLSGDVQKGDMTQKHINIVHYFLKALVTVLEVGADPILAHLPLMVIFSEDGPRNIYPMLRIITTFGVGAL